jgi:hypothetical protein
MWTSPIFPPSRVRKAPYGVMRLTVPSMTAPTSRSARTPPRSGLRRPPCRSTPAHRRIASLPSARLGRQRLAGIGTGRGARVASKVGQGSVEGIVRAVLGRVRSGQIRSRGLDAVGCGGGSVCRVECGHSLAGIGHRPLRNRSSCPRRMCPCPSNRRSATLSIRPFRSLRVDLRRDAARWWRMSHSPPA